HLCGQDPEGGQARRLAGGAADEVRAGHQPEDRQSPGPHHPPDPPLPGRRGTPMNRGAPRTIGLLVTLTLGLLVAPLVAAAQKPAKVSRIGVLSPGVPPAAPDWPQRSPFWQALRALGWVEGQTIAIEYRWAEGTLERLPALATDFVRLPVDVIVAGGN